jgi:hypothetical protein
MDMTRVLPALFAAAVFVLPPSTASAQWAPSSPTIIIVNPSPAWGPGVAATAWGGGCGAGWCGAGCGGGCGVGWSPGWNVGWGDGWAPGWGGGRCGWTPWGWRC